MLRYFTVKFFNTGRSVLLHYLTIECIFIEQDFLPVCYKTSTPPGNDFAGCEVVANHANILSNSNSANVNSSTL